MRRLILGGAVAALAAVLLVFSWSGSRAEATGGEGEAWPSFNESSACGAVYTRTHYIEGTGGIPRSRLLRGPLAATFGRTVDQVYHSIVTWLPPGVGFGVAVHERLLPALERVAATLEDELAAGNRYLLDPSQTSSIAARTTAGSNRLSRHTFGIAMDFNSRRNPYRADNQLVSDMPDWWVAAFAEAGFCWGGQWLGAKDAMHLAWQGPAFTPGGELPVSYPPLTEPAPFAVKVRWIDVVPSPPDGNVGTVLAHGDGDSAVDIVDVSRLGGDLVLDVSVASRRHNACSLARSVVVDAPLPTFFGFGDWDGRGGHDLWLATDDGGRLRLTVRYRLGGLAAETAVTTAIPMPGAEAWVSTADADRDGALDLFVIEDGRLVIWALDPYTGSAARVFDGATPLADDAQLMLGDFDGDELPDLWSLEGGVLRVTTAAEGYQGVAAGFRPPSVPPVIVDAAMSDYDGDGRSDLVVFDGATKHVWLGNTRLADRERLEVWFEIEEPECGEDEPTWRQVSPTVATSGFVTKGAVGWLERYGFAASCDPGDADGSCPARPVTAGELAAAMAWMLDLAPGSGTGVAAAGAALLGAGYDSPCPPGGSGCWDRFIARAELAVRFGMMLDAIDGSAPAPHRWVWPDAARPATPARSFRVV